MNDFSAIGGFSIIAGGNASTAQVEAQIHRYKELSSRLGVATPLFVPKPTGGLNTSRSQLLELLANASMLQGGGPSTIHNKLAADDESRLHGIPNGNESNLNYTQQLLFEIGQAPQRQNSGEQRQSDDFHQFQNDDNLLDLEYPSSFSHCLKILWQNDIKKAFSLSNPDGYFYMLYLKTCIKFFVVNFLISGLTMMAVCLYANSRGRGDLDAESATLFQLTSLGYVYESSMVYTVSLVLSAFTIVLGYMFLYDFCNEMLMFEFQPDQKIMD